MSNSENMGRAHRAWLALRPYIEQTEDVATAVRDLLADLRHYCDEQGVDFGAEDRVAHCNYLVELNGSSCSEVPA